jgi:nucleotide-binding universal stress UspA family protein
MKLQLGSYRNLLFPLAAYPEATSSCAIERAVTLAERLDAHLSAVAFEMGVQLPPGVYAEAFGLGNIIAAEYQRALSNAQAVLNEFRMIAVRQGIGHDQRLDRCVTAEISSCVVELAHVNDLTVVAIQKAVGGQRDIAEALLFGSGRPVLMFPESCAEDLTSAFDTITVAWDNKGPAARAVADALPFLRSAKVVRIAVVENEHREAEAAEPSVLEKSAYELGRHLARHGIEAVVASIDAKGDAAGDVLIDDMLKTKADMLVMGAYGHARLKEIVLGGATDTILRDPPGYVFMSR